MKYLNISAIVFGVITVALAVYGVMFKHPLCVSLMPAFGLATVILELIILKMFFNSICQLID